MGAWGPLLTLEVQGDQKQHPSQPSGGLEIHPNREERPETNVLMNDPYYYRCVHNPPGTSLRLSLGTRGVFSGCGMLHLPRLCLPLRLLELLFAAQTWAELREVSNELMNSSMSLPRDWSPGGLPGGPPGLPPECYKPS